MNTFLIILGVLAAAGAGIGIGYWIRHSQAKTKVNTAEAQAERTLQDAENRKQKTLLEAKEKALKILDDAKQEEESRRRELRVIQQKLEKHDLDYQQRLKDFQQKQEKLIEKTAQIDQIKQETEKLRAEQITKLESIAQLTRDEAKDILMKTVEEMVQEEFTSRLRKLERVQSDELEKRANNVLSMAIQRNAASHAVETTTSSVHLPSDEMKGRIIGKEGRNIKAIEQLTGTEIIVDDTPEAITVSGFSPIRRQVAKIALEKLIEDGRIQPAKIEEAVENAKKELALDIKKAGEDALYELGIPLTALDPKLIQILGRLKYRTSYGQNVLRHSIEVALLAGMIGQELKADVTVCKRGGLLHDIGKAVDHDVQGAHPEIGYNILKKFGMPEEICYQSLGHHEDKPATLEGIIVKAADAISGARPGARKESYEMYVQRLEELEKTATSFPGVEKAYAIQAGREVRVFVEPKQIDDFAAFRLAKDIAMKVEAELKYPGEVKITVIRETRVVEYAR
ncbi:MAG: ribonuclease Y [Patescibacteria group bacterium]|nr:ribonuclease Y [Patescibacteria group bacterium]